jgi:DNA-binding MarR family transcriptional regulator
MSVAKQQPPESTVVETLPPLGRDLGWLLTQAAHAILTQQTARMEGLGIVPRGYCVMATAVTGQFTQTEIAQAVGLDKTTMVVTVDALEQAGLVERLPSKTDRRARVVGVTKAGRRKVAEAEKVIGEVQSEVLASLTERQRETLLDALGSLVCGPLGAPTPCINPVRRRAPRA